jgi:acyl-CoA thioester hydrolase
VSSTVRIPLRFADIDVNRHVNNVAYFALMETARITYMQQVRDEGELGRVVVVHADIDYLHEVTMHSKYVDIDMSVIKIGTSSITLLHDIRDETGLAARGHAVLVAVAKEGGSRPLTEGERETLGRHLQPVD